MSPQALNGGEEVSRVMTWCSVGLEGNFIPHWLTWLTFLSLYSAESDMEHLKIFKKWVKGKAISGAFFSPSLESGQAWSLPFAFWELHHGIKCIQSFPCACPFSTCHSAVSQSHLLYGKSKCVFTLPLSLWQVNKEKHLLGERTELSVKNPKHPSRKSQTALKSETKTTKSWQRGASISSNPHLSF